MAVGPKPYARRVDLGSTEFDKECPVRIHRQAREIETMTIGRCDVGNHSLEESATNALALETRLEIDRVELAGLRETGVTTRPPRRKSNHIPACRCDVIVHTITSKDSCMAVSLYVRFKRQQEI